MNFLYNLDRAIASAAGAPPQETISSEVGRLQNKDELAKVLAECLDDIQKDHCERAIKHADALDKIDDGFEG